KRMNIILDELHAHLKPKIALVGFAGVGKTTIKKLIKLDEIPLQHVPTITGEIATIKIGRLFFKLFDFAGQEQFKFLWKSFIKESDAVLIVTDSTVDNVEESKFFIDLKSKEVPYARAAIIGNKQDLSNALSINKIETITGIRTYPMIANRKENRNKMIRIIADVLDMSTADSPLLKELFESTDLSSETLFGKDEMPFPQMDSSIIIEDGSVDLTQNEENLVEKTVEVKSTKERVDEIITKSVDQKPMLITKGRWKKQRLDTPIIDGLINAELYKEIVNSDSFTLNEALSILFTIINCVYLTKTNPKEYPKFSSFLSSYNMDVFDTKKINIIRKFYLRIINSI
ncbi:MAG: ADP-ribosylation factor-like protein, partial [Promethearchaeota archaeon]